MKVISYGGGVQSTALIVLAAQGEIDYKLALFSNVGDDSENPATIEYVREIATPYAKRHGVEVRTIWKVRRDGSQDTLMDMIDRQKRSIPIPIRMEGTGKPGNRKCTGEFKIKVIAKETKRLGATPDAPATVALGISTDEWRRMRDSSIPHQVNDYPLIDLKLSRDDCVRIIGEAGLSIPEKSSCYFCPFKTGAQWDELKRDHPDLYEKSQNLERMLIERRLSLGLRPAYLRKDGLESDATCDIGGYCHS
mgnify:FL=1